ncbi:hypothetical protein ABT282_08185 [Streptomyces sp. NPDC000927]|uniref:hypothetical protein n=1 Tax=Streptomyces sp. NPDC000927 TaxID=3154371 RepID=UPI00331961D7
MNENVQQREPMVSMTGLIGAALTFTVASALLNGTEIENFTLIFSGATCMAGDLVILGKRVSLGGSLGDADFRAALAFLALMIVNSILLIQ